MSYVAKVAVKSFQGSSESFAEGNWPLAWVSWERRAPSLRLLQVTILVRRPDDEILLMASDGLWDVLNNSEACTLAKRCLRRARQRGASRQSAARIAATVLTRAAVDRGSRDNVTVSSGDYCSISYMCIPILLSHSMDNGKRNSATGCVEWLGYLLLLLGI